MEEHENIRSLQLERLKETIDTNVDDKMLHDTFSEVYDTIALVSSGVDDAHKRLNLRKDEIAQLDKKMTQVMLIVKASVKASEDSQRKSLRNSKVSMVANLFAVGFSLFLVFGGAEALKQLGIITTAIKTLEILT